jgi:hypothetical protein
MKHEFNLTHLVASTDPLTDRVTFTESIEFRVWTAVAGLSYLSISLFNLLDIEMADWQVMLLAATMVIAYGFACMGVLFRRSSGKAELSENEVQLFPTKKKEQFPDSPIKVNSDSEIQIYVIQKLNWFNPKVILQISVSNEGEPATFTIKLGSKKSKEQYLEVLESWYRRGYSLEEFDVSGSRIFKLDRGRNYADVQEIKKEYGINW